MIKILRNHPKNQVKKKKSFHAGLKLYLLQVFQKLGREQWCLSSSHHHNSIIQNPVEEVG
jgi:hypothetical protein